MCSTAFEAVSIAPSMTTETRWGIASMAFFRFAGNRSALHRHRPPDHRLGGDRRIGGLRGEFADQAVGVDRAHLAKQMVTAVDFLTRTGQLCDDRRQEFVLLSDVHRSSTFGPWKRALAKVDVPVKYVGFEIPNEFVIGYGLDFAERYRNLPYVGVLHPDLMPEGA